MLAAERSVPRMLPFVSRELVATCKPLATVILFTGIRPFSGMIPQVHLQAGVNIFHNSWIYHPGKVSHFRQVWEEFLNFYHFSQFLIRKFNFDTSAWEEFTVGVREKFPIFRKIFTPAPRWSSNGRRFN